MYLFMINIWYVQRSHQSVLLQGVIELNFALSDSRGGVSAEIVNYVVDTI